MRGLLQLVLAAVLMGFAAPAAADELRPAVVELVQRDTAIWVLEWKLPVATAADADAARAAAPIAPDMCRSTGEIARRSAALAVFGRAQFRCEGALAGAAFGLTSLGANTDAIARIVPLSGPSQTARLTPQALTIEISAEPTRWQVLVDYLVIGAEHILLGWDHLLFVIALVLLVRRGWAVIKAATAFTLAHSMTLVATTLGYAGLPSRPVEALIALSIVFLAVEVALVLREPERMTFTRRAPWLVAFVFGLVHGFGFAGALAEIGLPRGEIAAALLAFNLGVEAGQLLVVAVTLAVLAILSRAAASTEEAALKLATYAIGITGSFWLIERVAGF